MMKASTLFKIGGAGLVIGLGYLALKNAGSIGEALGSTIGSGINSGFKNLSDSFLGAFDSLNPTKTSAEQVANTLDLKNAVNIPTSTAQSFAGEVENRKTSESLALAGLLEKLGSNTKVDVSNRDLIIENEKGSAVQPFDFAFDTSGMLKTGTEGISQKTLDAQAQLSKQYGIVTFDKLGNISTVGGLGSSL